LPTKTLYAFLISPQNGSLHKNCHLPFTIHVTVSRNILNEIQGNHYVHVHSLLSPQSWFAASGLPLQLITLSTTDLRPQWMKETNKQCYVTNNTVWEFVLQTGVVIILRNWVTSSMEQSPSWEADNTLN
jgi:hypothetical protein